ncbi:MAG: hypothetical protein IPG01_17420 [Chitinophagaceae bacterium]|nr:hypothetical protein [Chitinophagaceae bacterium]
MMKCRYLFFIVLLTGLCCCKSPAKAQCNSVSGATLKGTIIPTSTYQSIAVVNAGEYWNFTASTCNKYVFSFCPADGGSVSWDTQFTIDDNTGVAVAGAYNDDNCGNQSYLEWAPVANGTYRIYVTRYSCQNIGPSSGTLVYKVIPLNTATSEYSLVGDASAPSGCASLTADATNNIGCAWDVNSTFDFSTSFSYDFTVNLGSDDNGADGICFVMQNDPQGLCTCGGSGGGMGAAGILKSVIVELDTYLNYEDRDDGIANVLCSGGPNPDHIDLWLNGNVNPSGTCGSSPGARIIPAGVALMNGASAYNIENGMDHTLRISWIPSGATGTLTVSVLDNSGLITYATFSYAFNPTTIFGTTTPYFGFTASTGALSNQQSACLSPMLLPVELASFTATCQQTGDVLVKWKTVSELNNDHFIIERSVDGSHYSEIMTLPGAGTSAAIHEYSWTDKEIIPGTVYYRIADHAINGSKVYSPAVSVSCEKVMDPVLSAYADGNGYLNISLDGTGELAGTLRVIDISGKILVSLPVNSQLTTQQKLQVYTGNLPEGVYLVSLNNRAIYYCTKLAIF